jgi:hypothetical protein
LRSRHYSRRTGQAYRHWVKRFIFFFHSVRHPAEMAEPEINAFLTHPAVKEKISASMQDSAAKGIDRKRLCNYAAMSGTVLYRPQLSAIAVLDRLYTHC